jgi:hypothetical protein
MEKVWSFCKRRPLRAALALLLIISVAPTWVFLDSIHYRVADYFLAWGPHLIQDFGEHKGELELLVQEVDHFVASQPDFFEDFSGDCYVDEKGILFERSGMSDQNDVFYKYSISTWENIKNYTKIFPDDFYYLNIYIDRRYPNYVMFCSDERTARVVVYTRGERPKQLIDSYWERYDFVRVKRLARGWYDIAPRDRKPISEVP